MDIKAEARKMKLAAPLMASSSNDARNAALKEVMTALEANKAEIFAANEKDVANALAAGTGDAVIKRLKFTEGKLNDCISGIKSLISLPDPLGKVTLKRELDENLVLTRLSVPIGVIGVIFEARPDAMVQISCLCVKSGNCAVLKGGKETVLTNKAIFEVIKAAVIKAGLPENCLLQCELHNEIDELLGCDGDVDLIIPRGSNKFVRYIMDNTKIPVMGHSDGICHIYVDRDYDKSILIPVIRDAKTQYTAACNAVETILVNRDVASEVLPEIKAMAEECGIKLYGNSEVMEYIGIDGLIDDMDYDTEYLSLAMSLKVVTDVAEACDHINRFGSHHTDSIITENDETAEYFMNMVDSAGVYRNISTRFADGFRYGFGAEVGISTGKLHARGPVGLEGLVTYKYRLEGHGNIVGDYASGKATFKFKDLV